MPKSIPHTDARIDEAMNAVLDKERESRARIKECEREASALLDTAQRRARAISDRTDARIIAFRQRCARTTRRAVDELLAGDSEQDQRNPAPGREADRIDRAARRVAEKLAGDAPKENGGESCP